MEKIDKRTYNWYKIFVYSIFIYLLEQQIEMIMIKYMYALYIFYSPVWFIM